MILKESRFENRGIKGQTFSIFKGGRIWKNGVDDVKMMKIGTGNEVHRYILP